MQCCSQHSGKAELGTAKPMTDHKVLLVQTNYPLSQYVWSHNQWPRDVRFGMQDAAGFCCPWGSCSGMQSTPGHGFILAPLGFACFLSPKAEAFASHQATPFPSSLHLPSESFSYHQTLNPSCSCQSLFFPLSSPFFPFFAAPADIRQPPRPSPAGRSGCCDSKETMFLTYSCLSSGSVSLLMCVTHIAPASLAHSSHAP